MQLAQPLDEVAAGLRPVGPIDIGDQDAADARRDLSRLDALGQAGDDFAEFLAGREVAGRGEEHLPVAKTMDGSVDQRLVGNPGPVAGIDEDLLDEPEHGEERIERVISIKLCRIVDGQPPAGLPCQLHDRRWTYRAFDVTVEFDLGNQVEGIAELAARRVHLNGHLGTSTLSLVSPW
jgi:hypothetical protein